MARGAAVFVGVLLAACSSKGTTGPKGDPGQDGAAGQGVTVEPLAVGNVNCPHGGTRFVAGAAVSYACNGAPGQQGIQGPQGEAGTPAPPRLLLKTANGTVVGAAFPFFPGPSNVAPYVGVGFASPPALGLVNMATGRLVVDANVYFAQAGCAGDAAMAIGTAGPVPLYAYQALNADRISVATATAPAPFLFLSRYDPNGIGCNETGGVVNVKQDAWRAAEITGAPYPFALPLTLAYE